MPQDPNQRRSSGRPSVLVVEDEMMVAMDIQMILKENGFRVLGPDSSVGDALRLLDKARADIAMLDVNLRGETVVPVARHVRRMGSPFVLASAYDSFDFGGPRRLPGWETSASRSSSAA